MTRCGLSLPFPRPHNGHTLTLSRAIKAAISTVDREVPPCVGIIRDFDSIYHIETQRMRVLEEIFEDADWEYCADVDERKGGGLGDLYILNYQKNGGPGEVC